MLFSANARNKLFKFFAIVLLLAAIYHLAGVFFSINDSPAWRHALFVIIDLYCVYAILKRPPYIRWLALVFFLQQSYTHGSYMIKLWHDEKQIHWISLFILLCFPLGLICLFEDYNAKHQ